MASAVSESFDRSGLARTLPTQGRGYDHQVHSLQHHQSRRVQRRHLHREFISPAEQCWACRTTAHLTALLQTLPVIFMGFTGKQHSYVHAQFYLQDFDDLNYTSASIATEARENARLFDRSLTSRSLNLSPRSFRDTDGNSRVRDLLMLDALLTSQNRAPASAVKPNGVLGEVERTLRSLDLEDEEPVRINRPSNSSSVASTHLADILTRVRSQAKMAKKYHQQAVDMLKQPYMHVEGSRYCLSLGVHSHSGTGSQAQPLTQFLSQTTYRREQIYKPRDR